MEGYMWKALRDDKIIRKAKKYYLENGMVKPVPGEIEEIVLGDNKKELLKDYLELAHSLADDNFDIIEVWQHGLPLDNTPDYDKYFEAIRRAGKKLVPFYCKWGPMGIYHDRALFSEIELHSDGSRSFCAGPVLAFVRRNEVFQNDFDSDMDEGVWGFDNYAAQFFPKLNRPYPKTSETERFYSNYCEDVITVLLNPRLGSTVKYIRGLFPESNKQFPLVIPDANFLLFQDNDGIRVRHRAKSTIELCQTLYFLNVLSGGEEHFQICQNKRCKRDSVFSTADARRKYCSKQCRDAVRARLLRNSD